jgi:hypothetical protein
MIPILSGLGNGSDCVFSEGKEILRQAQEEGALI